MTPSSLDYLPDEIEDAIAALGYRYMKMENAEDYWSVVDGEKVIFSGPRNALLIWIAHPGRNDGFPLARRTS